MANRFELAHQAWPILARAATEHRILTYLDLATALGYRGARVAKFPLWSIQDFCIEKNLPPLTSIVVNKRSGIPGAGFIAWEGDIGDAHARVFGHDWSTVPIPFSSRSRLTTRSTERTGKKDALTYEVADSETVVNSRGPYQALFRNQLMISYSRRCALCDTRHPALLVASHIVPWSLDSKNRLNPRNGILLCKTHDAAFEAGILRILPDCTVELVITGTDKLGVHLADFLHKHTAAKLRSPHNKAHAPSSDFLTWRLSRGKAQQGP